MCFSIGPVIRLPETERPFRKGRPAETEGIAVHFGAVDAVERPNVKITSAH